MAGGQDGGEPPMEDEEDVLASDTPPPRRGRGPLAAAVGSVVWPGLGHLVSGQRRRGLFLAGSTLLLLIASLLWVTSRRRTAVVAWSVQPPWLRAAIVASIVVLGFRLIVAIDAYRRRRGNQSSRPSVPHIVTLIALAVVAVVPHAIVVQYAAAQLDLLDEVFTATDTVAARPTPLSPPASASASATTVAPTTSVAIATTVAPTTAPPTTAAPTTAPPTTVPNWDGDERLNILLLGGDGGFDRSGVRTDTIIALSIEVATGDAVAFSVPRNWQRMQFPAGTPAAEQWPNGYIGIANELYRLGTRFPDAFPGDDPGGASIKSSVAQLLGIPIHYYALVDMVGVVEAIDLFGGIDLTVTEWIDDDIKPITPGGPRLIIQTRPGDYHFDGLTALAYIRARTTSSDYHRMSRQRCVIGAMVDQISVGEIVTNYPDLAGIISDHLITDIPLDRLPELLEVAALLDTDRMLSLNFIPPEYPRGAAPIELVRERVAQILALDIELELDDLDAICGSDDE